MDATDRMHGQEEMPGAQGQGETPPHFLTRLRVPRGTRALLPGFVVALSLTSGGTSALAVQNIEGVWSFNGGRVAIQAQAGGTFSGTVVAPTKFAQCPHPIGEQMWTDISQQ